MNQTTHLNLDDRQGVTVIGFAEPTLLDAYHISQVGRELMQLIQKQGLRRIALDMTTIRMLSSQALGTLLSLRQILSDNDGKMAICGVDPRLYRVFKITNLQAIFEFHDDVDSAVAALRE